MSVKSPTEQPANSIGMGVKHSLELLAGFMIIRHLKLWELGFQKREPGVSDEIIDQIEEKAQNTLGTVSNI